MLGLAILENCYHPKAKGGKDESYYKNSETERTLAIKAVIIGLEK